VVDECLQFFGGYGYMLEFPIARAYIDSRVRRIAGGSSEVMPISSAARYSNNGAIMKGKEREWIFNLSEDHLAIREAIKRICSKFPDEYWSQKDTAAEFPHEFHRAMGQDGWLGITMPEELGGSGLGVTEAAIMMNAVAAGGGGAAAMSTIQINLFAPHPIVVLGTPEQKKRMFDAG